ncbi:toll/interleukin-1 receptor domain-containing protein [Bacillus pseudomycoides]|uniref:toll/interleukin-1 receptor domain-containing protein n=1 Tax=Bacillus pseudomycoides TaxID=64104 RepID=UPI0020D2897F|nr:toll/interleukin-1 receptor domain-containing protein [Bacillus pseudomycoides]
MQLLEVQSTLRELEKEKYDIYNALVKALRIAHYRFDLKEIIFFEINKIKLIEENNQKLYNKIKQIAVTRSIPVAEYRTIYNETAQEVSNLKKADWYNSETQKISKNVILISPVGEIIKDLEYYITLLEKNTIPDGLAPVDLYYATQRKNKFDAIYNHEILNLKTILTQIRNYIIDYLIQIENELIHKRERVLLSNQDTLQSLIDSGETVKNKNFVPNEVHSYIHGIEYVEWIQRCKMFLKQNVPDPEFINDFSKLADKANGSGLNYYDSMIGMLKSLIGQDFSEIPKLIENNKIDKIFISHSSKDIKYVKALVELLNDIGIKKDQDSIFCSSLDGYGIPHGESIYEFLKKELNNNNVMVLFVLSDNYYGSAPCLNEMGAAWITSKEYTTILTPNFDFKNITGAIDPTKISFKMNDQTGLNKFRDNIYKVFELEEVNYQIWENDRTKFLNNIKSIADTEASTLNTRIELEKVKKHSQTELDLQLRFINVTDRDIELQYIDCELIDEEGNSLKISIEDGILDDFKLMNKENKVVHFIIRYDTESKFKVRRNVREKAKINFAIV